MSSLAPSYGNYLMDKGYDVSGPISMFHFVTDDETDIMQVKQVGATSDQPLGVAQFHVTASEILKGKGCSVRTMGITQVYCTGAVSNGDQAGLVADGTVRAAQAGDTVVGQFRSNGVDGGRAALLLSLPGSIHP